MRIRKKTIFRTVVFAVAYVSICVAVATVLLSMVDAISTKTFTTKAFVDVRMPHNSYTEPKAPKEDVISTKEATLTTGQWFVTDQKIENGKFDMVQ